MERFTDGFGHFTYLQTQMPHLSYFYFVEHEINRCQMKEKRILLLIILLTGMILTEIKAQSLII